jgi:hypothetical protein
MHIFVWNDGTEPERTSCIGIQIKPTFNGYEYYTQDGTFISLIPITEQTEFKKVNRREENMSRMTTRQLLPQSTISPYFISKTNEERVLLEDQFMRPKDSSI